MVLFDEDLYVPFLVFAVPIVAIAGGILAYIIKIVSSHRLMETLVRERAALIAKGVDPDRIPATGPGGLAGPLLSMHDLTRLRAQGLLVAGFVTLAGGASFALVSSRLGSWEFDGWGVGDWGLGVVAASIGLALIVGGLILWPRGRDAHHGMAPRGG